MIPRRSRRAGRQTPPPEPSLVAIREMEDRIAARLVEAERSQEQVVAARQAAAVLLSAAETEAARAAAGAEAEVVDRARHDGEQLLAAASAEAHRITEAAERRSPDNLALVLRFALGDHTNDTTSGSEPGVRS